MDFRQISQPGQPGTGRPAAPATHAAEPDHKPEKASGKSKQYNWLQLFNGIMLIAIAILVGCVALAMTRSGTSASSDTNESQLVKADKYQAVFMQNGESYFGHIVTMNDQYIRLTHVYYLTRNSDASNSDYTLIKLGCQQIHNPYDQIVINRAQIKFWENIQDDGTVVTNIKKFEKQNPNGPDCTQVSTQTQADSSSNTQTGTTKK